MSDWHYILAGKPGGPVDEAGLRELFQTGTLTADSMVMREDMPAWQPLKVALPDYLDAPLAPPPIPVTPPLDTPPPLPVAVPPVPSLPVAPPALPVPPPIPPTAAQGYGDLYFPDANQAPRSGVLAQIFRTLYLVIGVALILLFLEKITGCGSHKSEDGPQPSARMMAQLPENIGGFSRGNLYDYPDLVSGAVVDSAYGFYEADTGKVKLLLCGCKDGPSALTLLKSFSQESVRTGGVVQSELKNAAGQTRFVAIREKDSICYYWVNKLQPDTFCYVDGPPVATEKFMAALKTW